MNLSKLAQLRSKTNRQLVAVIGNRLEAGSELLRRGYFVEAEKAYEEARVLLPLVDSSVRGERQRLEARLTRLREERTLLSRPHAQTAVCL